MKLLELLQKCMELKGGLLQKYQINTANSLDIATH